MFYLPSCLHFFSIFCFYPSPRLILILYLPPLFVLPLLSSYFRSFFSSSLLQIPLFLFVSLFLLQRILLNSFPTSTSLFPLPRSSLHFVPSPRPFICSSFRYCSFFIVSLCSTIFCLISLSTCSVRSGSERPQLKSQPTVHHGICNSPLTCPTSSQTTRSNRHVACITTASTATER